MTLHARADVTTDAPARYAKQLASHFGHKITVEYDGHGASMALAGGRAVIQAGEGVLTLLVEAPDAETLETVQGVVGGHLERFGARSELSVVWSPAG